MDIIKDNAVTKVTYESDKWLALAGLLQGICKELVRP